MFVEIMRLQTQTVRMLIEAQTVVGMRILGMVGLLPAAPGEHLRMITEKQIAFTEASMAAARAAMIGQSPAQVYGAALRPVGRKTRANSHRLTRRRKVR